MTNTQAGLCVIELISSVLNGKKAVLPPNADWQQIYELSRLHTVANIIYYSLENVDVKPNEAIISKFSRAFKGAVLREAQQENETADILSQFEKNKVCSLLLKGGIMKQYYPQPDMRQMGDIDFLIEKSHMTDASEILTSNGFACTGDNEIHVGFSKPPVVNIELHSSLTARRSDYFDKALDRGIPFGCYKYTMMMSPEDFYIYLVSHMAKHYSTYGTGIRSITDIYIFRNHFGSKLDMDYISKILDELNILKFERNMVFLSSVWFGDAPSNERTDKMTEYLINSGAYGLQKNLEANRFLLENINRHDTGRRKLLYFIKTVFPGKRYMGRRYSAIKKFSALLPVFWVVRWFQTLFGSIGSIRYRLVSVAETSENILEDSGFNPKEKNR